MICRGLFSWTQSWYSCGTWRKTLTIPIRWNWLRTDRGGDDFVFPVIFTNVVIFTLWCCVDCVCGTLSSFLVPKPFLLQRLMKEANQLIPHSTPDDFPQYIRFGKTFWRQSSVSCNVNVKEVLLVVSISKLKEKAVNVTLKSNLAW